MRIQDIPIEERLMDKVQKDADGCWLWTGTIKNTGYGKINYRSRQWAAHRLMYETFVGPIPEGLMLDHLCRVHHCVNPEHLEPVTSRKNFMRGVHPNVALHHAKKCKAGHDIVEGNIYRRPDGRAMCATCFKAYQRAYSKRKRRSG